MPLGPQLMRSLAITPGELGALTAIYTVAAAGSGVAGSLFVDRFDRKRAVVFFLAGFVLAVLATALAPSYPALAWARAFAGMFGGVLTANLMAIVADVVPVERRGRALGVIMSAFAIASILGLPVSLTVASFWSWRASYILLASVSAVVFVAAVLWVPPLRGHLAHARSDALETMRAVLARAEHRRAWLFTGLVSFSGFLIIPYISPYLVLNTGVGESDLPYYYLVGGIASLGSARLSGRLVDRRGARWTFLRLSILGIVVVSVLTHLPRVPLAVSFVVSSALFVAFPGRMVATMATATAAADPTGRGSFMSLNAAVQHLASGVAAMIAAAIVGRAADGSLAHYGVVGILCVIMMAIAIPLQRRVRGRPR